MVKYNYFVYAFATNSRDYRFSQCCCLYPLSRDMQNTHLYFGSICELDNSNSIPSQNIIVSLQQSHNIKPKYYILTIEQLTEYFKSFRLTCIWFNLLILERWHLFKTMFQINNETHHTVKLVTKTLLAKHIHLSKYRFIILRLIELKFWG